MFVKLPLGKRQNERETSTGMAVESILIDPAHIIKVTVNGKKLHNGVQSWTVILHDTSGGTTEVQLDGPLTSDAVEDWLVRFTGDAEELDAPAQVPSEPELPMPPAG
ncbi:hypothetical protein PUY80_15520 [Plantibacter flavus]|uniref:hypothetical protein n=1 Tax=Plantibacter flavus TaxID=150123 RepID=UPI002379F22E|nr:hypothetical protein [Plantibacter flavus]MDD9153979.1 hypothetical protein [Plantibacter flavus]